MWVIITAILSAVLLGLGSVGLAALAVWRSGRRLGSAMSRVTGRLSEVQVPAVRWKPPPTGRYRSGPESTAGTTSP